MLHINNIKDFTSFVRVATPVTADTTLGQLEQASVIAVPVSSKSIPTINAALAALTYDCVTIDSSVSFEFTDVAEGNVDAWDELGYTTIADDIQAVCGTDYMLYLAEYEDSAGWLLMHVTPHCGEIVYQLYAARTPVFIVPVRTGEDMLLYAN